MTAASIVRERDRAVQRQYVSERPVGQGTFGTVMLARDTETGETVAIKRVMQDPRFRNRELQIMRTLNHPNVVQLRNYYYLNGEARNDEYLHLVMEFVPDTLQRCCRNYFRARMTVPMVLVKVFMFQMLRSIGYLHLSAVNVCHRDIKPHNVLVNGDTGVLKICDFGSAKQLSSNEPNVAYICSRYYRAPELIFGNQHYTAAVDIWSVGCLFAEMLIGEPIFRGDNSMGQLSEIVKVLGTPSKEQMDVINKKGMECSPRLSQLRPKPWSRVFPEHVTAEAHDLCAKLLAYIPAERLKPFDALMHPFFEDLYQAGVTLHNGTPLPPLLWAFGEEERRAMTPVQAAKLVKLTPSISAATP